LQEHIVGLRRYAIALLSDPIEAEDLVQECLVRALSRAHLWSRVRDHRAYLFTILHNIYVDQRKQYRRAGQQIPIDEATAQLKCLPDQEHRIEIRDFRRGLNELPESYKTVILLIGLEGMTYRQAAETLGVPIGTIMSRLCRGREILRQRMNGDYPPAKVERGDGGAVEYLEGLAKVEAE
jgi:RNA polymerase sigma-70 factor (ECF subfamily)